MTGAALKEFLNEFAAIRNGDVAAEEAAKAQASFRTDLIQEYENLGSVLQSTITLLRNGRPLDQLKGLDLPSPIELTVTGDPEPQRG